MQQTIFQIEFLLDDDQAARLRLLAAREGGRPDDIVRKALGEYLLRHLPLPERQSSDPVWQEEFARAVQELRADTPADVTPEEIEAEITRASAELRQERLARRRA